MHLPLCICVYARSLSHVWLFVTLWYTVAPLSSGIFQARILEWVFHFLLGDLPDPGIKLMFSALAGGLFSTEPAEEPTFTTRSTLTSSSDVQMWELDHKEGWAPKNRCYWTVVPKETLFFFFNLFCLFIGCPGSSLPRAAFSSCSEWGLLSILSSQQLWSWT